MLEERKESREGSAELEGRRTAERRGGGENERFSAALPPPLSLPPLPSYFTDAADHGCQMAIAKFKVGMCLALWA